MKSNTLLLAVLICLATTFIVAQDDSNWQSLFNGDNLDNWEVINGTAEYHIEEDAIVGTSKWGTPNTFLRTKETYGDFILEVEIYDDPRLNSGIQIRSNTIPSYRDGVVHGYQVEIDPAPRAYSGGIYDESRRGWIYPLSYNPKGQKAFVNGTWNKYHIEAIGSDIRVWVNGIQTSNLKDDMTAEGFIGLQVHSIYSKDVIGSQIKWKNINIKTTDLEASRWSVDPEVQEINLIYNHISESEKRQGWRLLWDGKTTDGWRSARGPEFPDKGWNIQDGMLNVEASTGGESTNGGDIITKEKFSNFELSFEFRLTEGANSGVKYYVDPSINQGPGSSIGLEYQVLDDKKHPDAKKGVNGNRTVASLYDLITATNLSVPSRGKPSKGIGSWNLGRIIARDGKVEHWLNGFKVIEYDRHTQIFKALVAYSKYKDWERFGELTEGHILLQDHGDAVSFRSIKIREL